MNNSKRRKLSVILYWLFLIGLMLLFFTNDFGLVDIHKTAIITAVGVDVAGEEVRVTAEIAVPQPSQSGDNIKYTQVQGSGLTVADAMSEIKTKTGFYPQLQFCKLILVGDSCREHELFRILGCFYRKNYSELTASVAMCQGAAADILAMGSPVSDMTSEAILKILSPELKKSGSVSSVNLKDIAVMQYSKSEACFMPYIEPSKPGTSESGGNGENVGGENGGQQGGQNVGDGGGSGGNTGGEGGQSQGATEQRESAPPMEFTAARTAVFAEGKFKTFLDERYTLALNLLKGDLNFVSLPFDTEEKHYAFRLKNANGGVGLKIENGVPEVTLKFKANAQIQGVREVVNPAKTVDDDVIPENVLRAAEDEIKNRFVSLAQISKSENCDFLGLKDLLFKFNYKYFDAMNAVFLDRAHFKTEVNLASIN